MILEMVDFNTTEMSMEQLEEYFIKEEIPYVVRVNRDDSNDIEYHISAEDIPAKSNFIKDLKLMGDLRSVEMYIIYNK